MAKGQYPIPFDAAGNQMHYAERSWDAATNSYREPKWWDNATFENTLTYKGYCRGRSAAYFQFTLRNGRTVCMFLTDTETAIPHMARGVIEGKFTFTKRGQNYGIQLVLP